MIEFRTIDHGPVPPFVEKDRMSYPTQLAVASGDTAWLAPLGIFPHDVPDGFAPWGYEWTLIDGVYVGALAGSAEERAAALAAQELAAIRPVWRDSSDAIESRDNHAVAQDATQSTEARLAALYALITGAQ